jgi:hypothetical protein
MTTGALYNHFHCTQCGIRTSIQHSLGMLECAYHPHTQGPLRPMASAHSLSQKRLVNAHGCYTCALSYAGLDYHAETAPGCTSMDHLSPQDGSLKAFLTSKPYAVMPTKMFYDAPYLASTSTAYAQRPKSGKSGTPAVLHIREEKQLYDQSTGTENYLRLKLFGPPPHECALPYNIEKMYEGGVTLSLVSLYNESAERYDYPLYNSSAWVRNVLHANRHILSSGEKDSGGGVAVMTEDDVCERELYADDHQVKEREDFTPFVVVLRVETESMDIITQ